MAGFDSLLPNFSSAPFTALRAPGYGEIHELAKNQNYDFIQITAISLKKIYFHYNIPLFSNSKAMAILPVIILSTNDIFLLPSSTSNNVWQ